MAGESMRGFSGGALTPEQEHTGWLIVRRCDAFDLLQEALDRFERDYPGEYGVQDIENARDELRILRESAESSLWLLKQRYGITE